MNAVPMMLPFLARTHGLSDLRAEELWWDASKYARNATGEFDTPKYWKSAYDRLINLVKAEAFVNETRKSAAWGMAQPAFGKSLLLATELLAEMSANARNWFKRAANHAH